MKKILIQAIIWMLPFMLFAQTVNYKLKYYPNRTINCTLDADSVLWIGTSGGILKYNYKLNKFIDFQKGLVNPYMDIVDITKDSKGTIYFVANYNNYTVFKYAAGKITEIPIDNEVFKTFNTPKIISKNGKTYLVTQNVYAEKDKRINLGVLSENKWKVVEDTLLNSFQFHCFDEVGNMWYINNTTRDLMKFDMAAWHNYGHNELSYSWGKESEIGFSMFRIAFVLEEANTIYVMRKEARKFFIGTKNGDQVTWQDYYDLGLKDLNSDEVNGFSLDKNRHLYVFTEAGFFHYTGTEWKIEDVGAIDDLIIGANNTPYYIYTEPYYEMESFSNIGTFQNGESVVKHEQLPVLQEIMFKGDKLYGIGQDGIYIFNNTANDVKKTSIMPMASIEGCVFDSKSGNYYFASTNGIYSLKNGSFSKIPYADADMVTWPENDYFRDIVTYKGKIYAAASYNQYYDNEYSRRGGLIEVSANGLQQLNVNGQGIVDGTMLCNCNDQLFMYSSQHQYMIIYSQHNPNYIDSVAGIQSGYPLAMACKNNTDMFILYNEGFYWITPDTMTLTLNKDITALVDAQPIKALIDNKGNVLFPLYKGIEKFDGKTWTTLPYWAESIFPQKMIIDYLGHIWVLADNQVYMLNGMAWINISKQYKLPSIDNIVTGGNNVFLLNATTGLFELAIK